MRIHRRRGSVTKTVLCAVLLFLVFNAMYYGALYVIQHFAQSVAGTTSTATAITTTGVTTLTSNGTITTVTTTSTASFDNSSLAQLQSLSFSNSSQCSSFLDQKWWDTAIQASGKTVVTIVPNTAYALPQSYNGWATYLRENTTFIGLDRYAFDFMTRLAAQVTGTHDMTKAAALVKNYTSFVAAVPVTAADYVSFGGLSALRVGTDTGNLTLAMAQTFPAQVYQLFVLSQDCSYSEQQRATFFGTAMSMSLFVLATSGKDGFGPKFEGLLTKLGLRDSWTGMKGYIKEIMDTSPEAAYHMTMVLSAMAKKFPNAKLAELVSFTSSRIANMVKVLKNKGFSSDEISQKVADLSKAVDESDDERHVADVADATSYQIDGFIMVTTKDNLEPLLFAKGSLPRPLSASFVALVLSDFKVGEATALKVTIHKFWYDLDTKLTSYEAYEGGKTVEFLLPKELVQQGDDVGLSFELLPVEDFASSIPPIVLSNPERTNWLATGATLKDFKVVDGVLQFGLIQDNHWWSGGEFTVEGQVVKYPGQSGKLGGIYAEFSIMDYVGRPTNLRLRFDGFSFNGGGLQIVRGGIAQPVSLVSFDGLRLKIVYRDDNRVTTIYLDPPSEAIYSQSVKHPYSGSYLKLVQGKYTSAWQIDNVVILRDLEKQMLKSGSAYDLGRIGSENAYVACDKQLGLKNLIIEDPAQGGRDLYTQDNAVAIQARFLKNFDKVDQQTAIQNNLFELADKLQQDYKHQQPQMQDGYAILSYVDTDGSVKTIILEVPKW